MNDFKKEYKFFKKDVDRVIKSVLDSGWYILGKNVQKFEKEFAKYIGSEYCIGVANGLEALQISLLAAGVNKEDEVITVSNSAVSTALAISLTGAEPIFVDIDNYFHLDPKKLEEKITKKTKAIIPVHLFGQVVDIVSILKIAKKHKLMIIEDAAQAHGVTLNAKKAGSFGDLGCFSFYPTKNLGAYGDGGAITTNSKDLYEKCLLLRNYEQKGRYNHKVKGLNSRLDEIQASILRIKLKKLELLNKNRQQTAKLYIKLLKDIPQIELPKIRSGAEHVYYLFVIKADKRDQLQKYLQREGVQTLIHYPVPIHKQDCYKNECRNLYLKNTQGWAKTILSLPIHPFLTLKEVEMVCLKIKLFYKS